MELKSRLNLTEIFGDVDDFSVYFKIPLHLIQE